MLKINEQKENTAANCVQKPTSKVYHKSVEFKAQLIAYVLTIIVIMIAVMMSLLQGSAP